MSKTIKKTILDVLEDFAERQPNLNSSAARETIAKRLHDALFGEFTPDDYPYNIESGAGRTEEEIDGGFAERLSRRPAVLSRPRINTIVADSNSFRPKKARQHESPDSHALTK